MGELRFTSEFSTYSTSSTTLSVLGPDGGTVFENTYDLPGLTPVVGLADILEEDMRRRGITTGRYTVDGTEYDVVYREERDGMRAERYAELSMLTSSRTMTVPAWADEDIVIPVYSREATVCRCSYMFSSENGISRRSLDYPLAAGLDEIRIHTSQLDSRPALVTLQSGARRMSVLFTAAGQPVLTAAGASGLSVAGLEYRDSFGHVRRMELPAVTEDNPSVEQTVVRVLGRKRLAQYKEERTGTLSLKGLPRAEALELQQLRKRDGVRLWRLSELSGVMEPVDILVTDVSGGASDDPGSLNDVKVTFEIV